MSWMVFGSKKILHKKEHPEDTRNKRAPQDLSHRLKRHDVVDPSAMSAVAVIGRGGYGKVMLMRSKDDSTILAVKEVSKKNLVEKPDKKVDANASTKIEHAEMENMVLQGASDHPFITTFHGAFQNREKLFIFMEYCAGGELFQHMQRQGVFTEARTRLYVAEITSALEYLHGQGIMYRDLKPENILVDQNGHLRLADFGLSIQFDKKGDDSSMRCYSICGTPEYIAPEIILMATKKRRNKKRTYGKTVDWWALGVLTYEMLFRIPPFYNRDRKTMLNKILDCDLKFPSNNSKAKPVSEAARDFIASLLKFEEKDRLGFGNEGSSNVKAHAFFDTLSFDRVTSFDYVPEFVPDIKSDQDTVYFDETFTKEAVRPDSISQCPFHIELTGYECLPDTFDEAFWYK